VFNAMGSMYVAVLFIGIKNANSVQPVVAVERTVFYRERAAGMYSALPYAFAQVNLFFKLLFTCVCVVRHIGKKRIFSCICFPLLCFFFFFFFPFV
jgi:hypothetical protein